MTPRRKSSLGAADRRSLRTRQFPHPEPQSGTEQEDKKGNRVSPASRAKGKRAWGGRSLQPPRTRGAWLQAGGLAPGRAPRASGAGADTKPGVTAGQHWLRPQGEDCAVGRCSGVSTLAPARRPRQLRPPGALGRGCRGKPRRLRTSQGSPETFRARPPPSHHAAAGRHLSAPPVHAAGPATVQQAVPGWLQHDLTSGQRPPKTLKGRGDACGHPGDVTSIICPAGVL